MKKGEITAFLSLVFLLLISFTGAMIESASIQVLKNQKRADMSLAMESVFAEYQKEALEKYDLFLLDGGYGTEHFDYEKIKERLAFYGANGMEQETAASELLTDNSGKAFYEQAIRYMENKLGVDYFKNQAEEEIQWNEQENDGKEYQKEETDMHGELDTMLEENGESLPEENNPIQFIAHLKESGVLQLVVPNPEQLSNQKLEKEKLASFRELQKGVGQFSLGENGKTFFSHPQLFFGAYLMEHFSNMTTGKESHTLAYEIEYLLAGKMSDRENLEEVVKKIMMLRFVVNYGYLLTDETKKGEAGVLALTLCSLLTVPGITEVVKHAVLMAWAYGESLMDLRVLLKGGKVPFVKHANNWQLQLSGLLTLGKEESWQDGAGTEEGMCYEDYLKGLLLLEKKEQLSMRAIDLIECQMQIAADHCVTRLEMESDCNLRRGIHYGFCTYFGYQ